MSSFVVRPRHEVATGEGPSVPPVRPARRPLPAHAAIDSLRPYLSDPAVTDVFVNGADGLFVDRGAGAQHVASWQAGEDEVRELAIRLIGLGGRHLDDAAPMVDVRWEHGVRVHAVLAPISCRGTSLSIRLPAPARPSLDDLARAGMVDDAGRQRLLALVAARANILVTGATGAGKTTLLGALLATVPANERIVTIEDVAELRIDHPHHVRLEARQPNLEGAGAVSLGRLVREALRMRPDRLVLGECRGEEIRELLLALNTGHDGGAGTLHAGDVDELPARLEALGALAGMDDRALARQVVGAIDAVVHVVRGADGVRRVTAVVRPVLRGERLGVEELA
jgi:pilus assembly protein CpaF